jgi:hypothetical protein
LPTQQLSNQKHEHIDFVNEQRQDYERRKAKALLEPDKAACFIIDMAGKFSFA